MMDNVLVLGGTGFVGRSVCDQLVARTGAAGLHIVVPSRRPSNAKHLQLLPTVRLTAADVHDERQLERLVRGSDAVINLVAILQGSAAQFQRAHVELPAKIARACVAAGVPRVVHVSALGVAPDAPSRYLRSKAEGERVLADSALALSVLRPSVIFGEHDRFLNLFAALQRMFPLMPLAGADAQFQPVWVHDVAQAVVRCLDDRTTIGKTFECAGLQVCTLRQIVEAVGRWTGHPRPVVPLPGPLARLQAFAMECLPGVPLMSRDNLDSMRTPNVATGRLPGLRELGIVPATMDSVVPEYLGEGYGYDRFNLWRGQHGG